ncbi:uncharacterized protein LOC120636588 [Pararge aegeria]|uniref:uncharacterized protein LOC120636588 n=1 Tax=Pararge aegeria TaxID=116150 RepID=UPI0019D2C11C|nr:uncharacterized protein LOC120636588 [Pararge aegeria]
MPHSQFPQSNIAKFSGYDPNKYALDEISPTITADESLTPNQPPRLTQKTVNKFLRPLTKELDELPPRPTINELPETVIDKMVLKDKAFWVDKPGSNSYTLHDAYYNYGMTTEKVLPPHQDVFPRSYQYDLDCVKYRRQHACDGLKQTLNFQKPLAAHCRTCTKKVTTKASTSYEAASDSTQRRWRYYPDLTARLTPVQTRLLMNEVGRPFKHEACNWYYENYPPIKYNCIMRKFSK